MDRTSYHRFTFERTASVPKQKFKFDVVAQHVGMAWVAAAHRAAGVGPYETRSLRLVKTSAPFEIAASPPSPTQKG